MTRGYDVNGRGIPSSGRGLPIGVSDSGGGGGTGFFEDFESGNLDNWQVEGNQFSIYSDRVWNGSYSAAVHQESGTNYNVRARQGYREIGESISSGTKTVSFYWNENSNSNGGSIGFESLAADGVCGFASNNPQWEIYDANGWTEVNNGVGYGTWIYVEFNMDFDAGTYDVLIESQGSSTSFSDSGRPLASGTYEQVSLWTSSGSSTRPYNGVNPSDTVDENTAMWYDDITA